MHCMPFSCGGVDFASSVFIHFDTHRHSTRIACVASAIQDAHTGEDNTTRAGPIVLETRRHGQWPPPLQRVINFWCSESISFWWFIPVRHYWWSKWINDAPSQVAGFVHSSITYSKGPFTKSHMSWFGQVLCFAILDPLFPHAPCMFVTCTLDVACFVFGWGAGLTLLLFRMNMWPGCMQRKRQKTAQKAPEVCKTFQRDTTYPFQTMHWKWLEWFLSDWRIVNCGLFQVSWPFQLGRFWRAWWFLIPWQ